MSPIYLDKVEGINVKLFMPEEVVVSPLYEKGGLLFAVGIALVCGSLALGSAGLCLVGLTVGGTGAGALCMKPKVTPERWVVNMGEVKTVDMLKIMEEYDISKDGDLTIFTKRV